MTKSNELLNMSDWYTCITLYNERGDPPQKTILRECVECGCAFIVNIGFGKMCKRCIEEQPPERFRWIKKGMWLRHNDHGLILIHSKPFLVEGGNKTCEAHWLCEVCFEKAVPKPSQICIAFRARCDELHQF